VLDAEEPPQSSPVDFDTSSLLERLEKRLMIRDTPVPVRMNLPQSPSSPIADELSAGGESPAALRLGLGLRDLGGNFSYKEPSLKVKMRRER